MPNIQRTPQKPQAQPDEVPRMADKSPEELEAERLEEEAKKAAAETERKKKNETWKSALGVRVPTFRC